MDRVQYVYGTLTVKMLDVQRTESSAGRSSRWLRWGFLSLMAAFSAALWIHRQEIQGWTTYGYLGVLAFSLLANAMILLPAPVLAVVFTLGGVFSPLGIGMAAGLGMALGELTGYAAGRAGRIAESQVERLSRTDAPVWVLGDSALGSHSCPLVRPRRPGRRSLSLSDGTLCSRLSDRQNDQSVSLRICWRRFQRYWRFVILRNCFEKVIGEPSDGA